MGSAYQELKTAINKKSKHKLRKGILRTDGLLLNREDVTLLLIAANPGTDSLIIIILL